MMTFSEWVTVATIWALTLMGCFFGGKAALRRRRQRRPGTRQRTHSSSAG